MALVVLFLAFVVPGFGLTLPNAVLTASLLTLCVAPLATAPLAVHMNRHR